MKTLSRLVMVALVLGQIFAAELVKAKGAPEKHKLNVIHHGTEMDEQKLKGQTEPGTLKVIVTPSTAALYLGKWQLSNAKCVKGVQRPAGSYEIKAVYGKKVVNKTVVIKPGKVTHLKLNLLEPPEGTEKSFAGIAFVWIPAGSFTMGSPKSERDRNFNEGPRHRVEITQGFWMGKYEVTQAQWEDVMGENPSRFKGPRLPVEDISWNYCQEFVKKLSSRHRGVDFALPTEAQWEYACRAETTTPFHFGATITPQQVNYNGNDPYHYAAKGLDRKKTTKVGSFPSNAWGLHDMHGNVYEWCQDWHRDNYYSKSPSRDPRGPSSGKYRVLRGGSWLLQARCCRSAYRSKSGPGVSSSNVGLRLVAYSQRKAR